MGMCDFMGFDKMKEKHDKVKIFVRYWWYNLLFQWSKGLKESAFLFISRVCLNEDMYVFVFRMIEVEVSETFGYFGIVWLILWMWLKICRKSLKVGSLFPFVTCMHVVYGCLLGYGIFENRFQLLEIDLCCNLSWFPIYVHTGIWNFHWMMFDVGSNTKELLESILRKILSAISLWILYHLYAFGICCQGS